MEIGGPWRAHNVRERVALALCDRNGSGGVGFSSLYQLLAMLPEIRKNIHGALADDGMGRALP
jgi:hypothetical protein